ncbi:MAG: hypothetical protein WDW38_006841 [Sanguina aurantia]
MAQANHPDYEKAKAKCIVFLQNFLLDEDNITPPKYIEQLQRIANREQRTLSIELDDVEEFFEKEDVAGGASFVSEIEANARRYLRLFAEAADATIPKQTRTDIPMDVYDVLNKQRRAQQERSGPEVQGPSQATNNTTHGGSSVQGVPPSLLRRFDVYLHGRTRSEAQPLRSVTSAMIGRLVRVRGIVTHINDVKPLISVVAYTDTETGYEIYQEVEGRTFTPLTQAPSGASGGPGPGAPKSKTASAPNMETRGSRFLKFQEGRIQEMADEVPEGATPRTMSVHLRGEVCRSMKPGDEVILSGIFLPEPYSGFKAMRAGLLTTTFLEAQHVVQVKKGYGSSILTASETAAIDKLGGEGDVYGRLARSIAPEIFGHEDVKKALLLLMVGGVTRQFEDGLKIRGDVHVCLMGDPGVAKSQILKYITRVSPRAVYTTGKGSSGVGLTAAVMRNQTTKELVLEGGALVLADKGICCIDEFDKMEEGDRTAIHEVMEQQTVSIAKAGITTTLNTRTTILAAANPAWGRYDKKRTPAENINLPAALLSRFDILWLILDEVDAENDERLAKHILAVHTTGEPPKNQDQQPPLPPKLLRAYISQAKTFEPSVPEELTDYIAAIYSELRQLEKGAQEQSSTYTTPRTLLSILRLGQALAKLRFDTRVTQSDIDEALRLMRQSKVSLNNESDVGGGRREDIISTIYRLVRDYALKSRAGEVPYEKIVELTSRHNVAREDILACVQEYADVAVWRVTDDVNGNPIVTISPEDLGLV